MTSTAARRASTNVAADAPRERASMPSAPLPANRSRTPASSTTPMLSSAEKSAARPLSGVGRVSWPAGAWSRTPPALPATTRTARKYRRAMASVRVVRIGRPGKRNAIDSETAARLLEEFTAFDADDGERVAVLTGDERAFCAGADLTSLPRLRPSGPLGPTRLQLSKPVIAAVEGWCVAGGLELALWCDLRVAGASARFGCLERRFGVPLIDGGTQRLPLIVGLGRALDLILTGREFSSDEGERIGFVKRSGGDRGALGAAVEPAEPPGSF